MATKIDDALKAYRWLKMRTRRVQGPKLRFNAWLVYCYLTTYRKPQKLHRNKVAMALFISPETVTSAKRELLKCGLLTDDLMPVTDPTIYSTFFYTYTNDDDEVKPTYWRFFLPNIPAVKDRIEELIKADEDLTESAKIKLRKNKCCDMKLWAVYWLCYSYKMKRKDRYKSLGTDVLSSQLGIAPNTARNALKELKTVGLIQENDVDTPPFELLLAEYKSKKKKSKWSALPTDKKVEDIIPSALENFNTDTWKCLYPEIDPKYAIACLFQFVTACCEAGLNRYTITEMTNDVLALADHFKHWKCLAVVATKCKEALDIATRKVGDSYKKDSKQRAIILYYYYKFGYQSLHSKLTAKFYLEKWYDWGI